MCYTKCKENGEKRAKALHLGAYVSIQQRANQPLGLQAARRHESERE